MIDGDNEGVVGLSVVGDTVGVLEGDKVVGVVVGPTVGYARITPHEGLPTCTRSKKLPIPGSFGSINITIRCADQPASSSLITVYVLVVLVHLSG